jgi:predicted restriction endonuclease
MSIPDFKVCPRCQKNKSKDEYHIRQDKGYTYLKSYCKKCSNKQTIKGQYDLCQCGNKKTKQSKKCQSCQNINQRKFHTIADIKHYHQKYGRSVMFQPVRSRARAVIKDRTCCEKCGYDKHVEACHIKPISSFPDDTPIDIVNDTSNIIALCPNCHWEFDNLK